jgi:hypothetical protein
MYAMPWAYKKQLLKLTPRLTEGIQARLASALEKAAQIKEQVSGIKMRGVRVYLYRLYEPYHDEHSVFTKELIDGKYFEEIFLRLSIYDEKLTDCTLDWQRHTGQWMTIDKGTLEECIAKANASEWFREC